MAVKEDRVLLARVLRFWQERGEADADRIAPSGVLNVKNLFNPSPDQQITALIAKGTSSLAGGQIWLRGPVNVEDEPNLWPIATVELEEQAGALKVCIRVAAFSSTPADGLRVDGWRFETAETVDGSPRPFAHCQRIVRWTREPGTLLSPFPDASPSSDEEQVAAERLRGVPETWPAFPLGCTTPAGLALAFVVAVNGRGLAQEAITGDAKLRSPLDELKQDMRRLALDPD